MNKRKKNRILLLALSSLCLYFGADILYDFYQLKRNGECTIGTVIGFSGGSKSARNTIYKFEVNGKYYLNGCSGYNPDHQNKNFRVLYDKENPKRNIIYLNEKAINNNYKCEKIDIIIKLLRVGGVVDEEKVYHNEDGYFK